MGSYRRDSRPRRVSSSSAIRSASSRQRETIQVTELGSVEKHRLISGVFIPRPVALVSTISETGNPNLAPFSFSMPVATDPILIAVSISSRRRQKDTAKNLRETGEAVVCIPGQEMANSVEACAEELVSDVDEFEHSNLTPMQSLVVAPPTPAEARVSIECRLNQVVDLGDAGYELFILEAILFRLSSDIMGRCGYYDYMAIDPLTRVGSSGFVHIVDQDSREGATDG